MTPSDFKELKQFVDRLEDSSEPFNLARAAFQRLAAPLELDVYFNYLAVNHEPRMWLSSFDGIPHQAAKEIQNLDFGHAVCGTVAQTRTPMRVEDVQSSEDDKTSVIRMFGVKAYSCFPLMAGDRFLGTLSFGSRRRTRFSEEENELLAGVARSVAAFMDRMVPQQDDE